MVGITSDGKRTPLLTRGHLTNAIRYQGLRLSIDGRTLGDNGTEYVVTMRDGRRFSVSHMRVRAFERAYAFLLSPEDHGVRA